MKYKICVIEDWLDALAHPKKRLTTWEEEFVESVTDQLSHKGDLSDKQVDVLERIYTEKT